MTHSGTDKDITAKLFSNQQNEVVQAIQQIKAKGNKHYLPVLFELLTSNPGVEIEEEVLKLLASVKGNDSAPAFVEAIRNPRFDSKKMEIVSTCWQNGLDFSNYLDDFVELVISETWEIAFEAFTVIENFEHFLPGDKLNPVIQKINRALPTVHESKLYFLKEIIKFIE